MKTKIITTALLASFFAFPLFAQDRTIVNATNSEISDNLDLRAIASIFGEAKDLEDFERQINDPSIQISNLDLNDDNQVDYLRVIESVENNTHLVIVQSVLGRDEYQDVATIEVQRDSNNQVQVQVVGDVYMYGENYIYEPVYVHTPIIYASFWGPVYHPYISGWYWNYYPTYYYAWAPFPIFRYRHNIGIHINHNNHYNYVTTRRFARPTTYAGLRGNYSERTYPNRSFSYRNTNVRNRYELDKTRPTRNNVAYPSTKNNGTRNNNSTRDPNNTRSGSTTRNNDNNTRTSTPRNNGNVRSTSNPSEVRTPRNNQNTRNNTNSSEVRTPRSNTNTSPVREIRSQNTSPVRQRDNSTPAAPRNETRNNAPRQNNPAQNERVNRR